MPDSLTIELPWGPSDNALKVYPVIGGRARPILSQEARDYYARVSALLVVKRVAKLSGPLRMEVVFHPPDRRRNDGPNRWKALQDSLKRRHLGRAIKGKPRKYDPKQMGWVFADDDSQVVEWVGRFSHVIPGGKCIVTLTKLPGEVQADLFNVPTLTKDEMKFARQIIKETEKYPQSERIA